jgi:hypothetical protein
VEGAAEEAPTLLSLLSREVKFNAISTPFKHHFNAISTPFQHHFNAISTPFQRHFNAISTPFQRHFNAIVTLYRYLAERSLYLWGVFSNYYY